MSRTSTSEWLREEIVEPSGLNVTELAEARAHEDEIEVGKVAA